MSESEFMLLDVDYNRRSRSQFLIRVLVVGFAFILGFVIISLILSSDTPILKRPKFKTNCSLSYDYDFDLLTLRWPSSICSDQESCPKYPADTWTIHGLWPTYDNNSWPEFCCFDRHFRVKDLEPIRDQMLRDWPNLEPKRTEDSLWQHEWAKHGTCTKTKQIDFFNTTLNLYKDFPIYEWLKESNILPSNDKTYNVSQFAEVLSKKLNGLSVVITCPSSLSETQQSKGTPYTIKEIRICINRNTTQAINCDQKSECKQPFIYPKSSQIKP